MFRIVLLLTAASMAGEIIVHDRVGEMNKAADDFGNAIVDLRREKEANRRADDQDRRKARLDSMQRVSDSLDLVMKRMELKIKEMRFMEMMRQDSIDAAKQKAAGPAPK